MQYYFTKLCGWPPKYNVVNGLTISSVGRHAGFGATGRGWFPDKELVRRRGLAIESRN
jgi:hypothetical protein